MGLHHQNNHGRVFHGLEAREQLKEKRSFNSPHIVMHNPNKAAARPADPAQMKYSVAEKVDVDDDSNVATVVSIVYQTVSGDFTGATAGYVTVTPSETATADAESATTASSSATYNADESAYHAAKSAATARTRSSASTTSVTSSMTVSPTASSTADDGSGNKSRFLNPATTAASSATAASVVVGGGVSTSRGATVAAGSPLSATRTADEKIANASSGMSGGAKAGLAIGIILAIALAAGLLFFCYRRKKNQNAQQEIIDEKRASTSSSFFGGKSMSEKHDSMASTRTAATAPRLSLRPVTQFLPNLADNRKSQNSDVDAVMSEKPKSMWERRSNASANPFTDAAVMSEKEGHAEATNPFDEPEGKSADEKSPSHSQKSSWEGSEPATPKSLKFGTASAVPVAATGSANEVPPVPKGPNNVHRVQLDFKPSMDDELELKSGQLVRMLHEYDDGWALCIRMDRSQQGVTPRTCLSKLPVKPRPQGPPSGPNGTPMTSNGSPGMVPRPLTPTGSRSQSPAGGVPARKPVPGQAL